MKKCLFNTSQKSPTAGVYQTNVNNAHILADKGRALGFMIFSLDLSKACDCAALLKTVADCLHFPEWYGDNWDALTDCLCDMSWSEADGYLLIIKGGKLIQSNDSDSLSMFISVLEETSSFWKTQNIEFWALVTEEHSMLSKLEVVN
jgi:hypothetical protein